MEWLRWILLAIGIVLIGAIYGLGRRHEWHRRSHDDQRAGAQDGPHDPAASTSGVAEPVGWQPPPPEADPEHAAPAADALSQFDPLFAADRTPVSEPLAERDRDDVFGDAPKPERCTQADPTETTAPERVVVLYVVAPSGERLVGAQLGAAFARHGLEHGDLGAFHARRRVEPDAAGRIEERPVRDEEIEFSVANVVEPGSFDPATMDTLSTPGVVLFLRLPGPRSPATALDRMLATARALGEELGARVLDEHRALLTRQAEQHLRDELRGIAAAPERSRR